MFMEDGTTKLGTALCRMVHNIDFIDILVK
jgi:hypothetical protein